MGIKKEIEKEIVYISKMKKNLSIWFKVPQIYVGSSIIFAYFEAFFLKIQTKDFFFGWFTLPPSYAGGVLLSYVKIIYHFTNDIIKKF